MLSKLALGTSFLGVQEAHGTYADMQTAFAELKHARVIAWTLPEQASAHTIGEHCILHGGADFIPSEALGSASDVENGLNSTHRFPDSSGTDSSSDGSCSIESGSDTPSASAGLSDVHPSCPSSSSCASPSRFAGCVNIIDLSIFPKNAIVDHTALVPGRCLETSIVHANSSSIFVNSHFFNWSPNDVDFVSKRLKQHLEKARENPSEYHVTLLGDWNWRYGDKPVLDTKTGQAIYKEPKLPKLARILKAVVDCFIRVEHDQYSHYNSGLKHLNDIDHIYFSAPGSAQLQHKFQASVERPEVLFAQGISDHAPLICKVSFGSADEESLPISPKTAKNPRFVFFLDCLCKATRFDRMLADHALLAYKLLIREAAKLTRNENRCKHKNAKHLHLPNLMLIARVVSSNKLSLAKKLALEDEFFDTRIAFESGRATLRMPAAFELEIRHAKSKQLADSIQHEHDRDKPNFEHISASTRLAKLWKNLGATQSIPAILCTNGEVAWSDVDKARELGGVWSHTFSVYQDVPPEALSFLSKIKSPWPLSGIHPPLTADFCRYMKPLKDSATGNFGSL